METSQGRDTVRSGVDRGDGKRAKAAADLAQARLRAEVCRLHDDGVSEQDIANTLGMSRQLVGRVVRSQRARARRSPRQTPLDIARMYATGTMSRAETVHALATFDYHDVPAPTSENIDVMPHTDIADLVSATLKGLIDPGMYEEIINSRARTR